MEKAMLPVHTILHPTDFSQQSHNAFRLACALARDYGAHLILLHVASRPVIGYAEGVFPIGLDEFLLEGRAKLAQLEPGSSVFTERRVEEGDAVEAILRVAEEVHSDLIVMGTHGRTGLTRLLMGSVAEHVVRKAACPVLTVKTPFPITEPAAPALAEAAASR
jgi:nucleotide-binding universal stress UspA family protein